MKIFAAAFVVACLALFSGCKKSQPEFLLPEDGISRFPTGEVLREGDIILARSYGLIGAMFANYSEDGGEYSHGAMIYRNAEGALWVLNYRPTGMETCRPEEFFSRYNRLALVRYTGDFALASLPEYVTENTGQSGLQALSATSRHWLWKNSQTRIPPDYRLDHDDQSAMFCLELTSTVYRDCGLPDPFFRSRKTEDDPLLTAANRLFKADVVEIRSPSSVLDNPDFAMIADWVRPEYDLREEALNEAVINGVITDIVNGYRPKRPSLGGRIKLRQIFALYHIVTKCMFWKPKQDLPDFIDIEVVDNAYMLYSYVARSKKEAKRRMLWETLPVFIIDDDREETLDHVRRIVREEMDCRRGAYLDISVATRK